MSVDVRIANESDHQTIQDLAHAIWPAAYGEIISAAQIEYMLTRMYSLAALAEQVTAKGHVFHLAQEDGSPVGFVSHQLDYPQAGATKIHKLYVIPSLHGRGVGRQMIEHVGTVARAAGQHSLMLNVNKYNKAQDFYRKLGFSVLGYEDIDIGAGFLMEDAIMQRTL